MSKELGKINSEKADEFIDLFFDEVFDENDIEYESVKDLIRLQKALISYRNITLSLDECINLWHNYSKRAFESWLAIPGEINEATLLTIENIEGFAYEEWMQDSYKNLLN